MFYVVGLGKVSAWTSFLSSLSVLSVSPSGHHTFIFGLGLRVSMKTSFMPSLSSSAHLYELLTFTLGLDLS